ncbi:hypothetical protein C7Y71_005920 [Pseudoprevotella muciniphila]|uniref:Uncharacterized protein n=1 Tax=Pseudoprevotella muciniphila TaxID=2133944 RepID=A0A5P8E6T4_9BACT|nr:hypothetical protein [Pseudoprevotella muciniphila]QFQ12587.1 hypothetical protein C7Y71_005920 [Pseudoprevotella muciniphila]
MTKKTYISPEIFTTVCIPANIMAVSNVNSNTGISGGGGAGSGVPQRSRGTGDWFGKDFSPFGDNTSTDESFASFGDE